MKMKLNENVRVGYTYLGTFGVLADEIDIVY